MFRKFVQFTNFRSFIMIFERKLYLNRLISGKDNGLVKIVTGIRRCGKSYLLFNLFYNHLLEQGVKEDNIISMAFDDWSNRPYCDPDSLLNYINSRIHDRKEKYYILFDEVQLLDHFVEVLLTLMHKQNCDIYVTGSNSRFLSSDVVTEFRGRGDEIRLHPLTFSEYYNKFQGELRVAWRNYSRFGGLPQVALLDDETSKENYLTNLHESTYLRDVVERHHLRDEEGIREVVQILASSIGSPTNPRRISNTFKSVGKIQLSDKTINNYITFLKEAFIINESLRYDVKGRKYIGTETKYYFADMGLRNAVLNFRQQEPTHMMENIIYNELIARGYRVDVGAVEIWITDKNGKRKRARLEIDFVINRNAERIYIQSAYSLPTVEKQQQEQRSLTNVDDSFRKVILTADDVMPWTNEQGIRFINVWDFLLDDTLLLK